MDRSIAAAITSADIGFTMSSSANNRRLRRRISNRESARRSRMRKQQHLEDLRSRVGRLLLEKTALAQRISAISDRCVLVRHENERFKAESAALCRRLSEIRQLLFLRHLDCLSFFPAISSASSTGSGFAIRLGSANEQIMASLIK